MMKNLKAPIYTDADSPTSKHALLTPKTIMKLIKSAYAVEEQLEMFLTFGPLIECDACGHPLPPTCIRVVIYTGNDKSSTDYLLCPDCAPVEEK